MFRTCCQLQERYSYGMHQAYWQSWFWLVVCHFQCACTYDCNKTNGSFMTAKVRNTQLQPASTYMDPEICGHNYVHQGSLHRDSNLPFTEKHLSLDYETMKNGFWRLRYKGNYYVYCVSLLILSMYLWLFQHSNGGPSAASIPERVGSQMYISCLNCKVCVPLIRTFSSSY